MTDVKLYVIKGRIVKNTRKYYVFTKKIRAISKSDALEKLYSVFGGTYGVKRRNIRIEEINEENVSEEV